MTDVISREIRLRSRPVGLPDAGDFELAEVRLPAPADGQVLVRNLYMSVDPYMRGRMNDRRSYVEPFQIGEALSGSCIGMVAESRYPGFRTGDIVHSPHGWREYSLSGPEGLRRIDPGPEPMRYHLGVLGLTGLTAYVGLFDIGRPKAGETVVVSAAAGAVGSVVCQLAKRMGCRAVGSAGTPGKVSWLIGEAGLDAAVNYRATADLAGDVGRLCPDGIDVAFENVGGAHLEAALRHLNPFGRLVLCGLIAQYNDAAAAAAPRNLANIITKRLTVGGFIVTDHLDRLPQFHADMRQWIAEGAIRQIDTVVDGLESAPQAFLDLFSGANIGKMIVRLGPDPF
jgi:hypothetical protein